MKTIIYAPPSAGCENSARVLASAITPALRPRGARVMQMRFPSEMRAATLARHHSASMEVDCAFFMERVVDHPALMRAEHRILIPNPEWLDPPTRRLAANCTHVWHKSHFSLNRLRPLFPKAQHAYLEAHVNSIREVLGGTE